MNFIIIHKSLVTGQQISRLITLKKSIEGRVFGNKECVRMQVNLIRRRKFFKYPVCQGVVSVGLDEIPRLLEHLKDSLGFLDCVGIKNPVCPR
jgi:hypothetical protein